MTARRRLLNRRVSETFDVASQGLRFTCTASWFADGRLGEIFLSSTKPSSQSDVNARDAAISTSVAIRRRETLPRVPWPLSIARLLTRR
jgi:hypothetical protein